MKKILVLMTGGTIGSFVHDGTVSVKKNSCRAIEVYRELYGDEAEFEIHSLMNTLSENLDKHHWETMVNYLLGADLCGYGGVIVTHGSDTLSYSSAMLGLCLQGLDIPVVLTASGLVPDDPESNAADNIHAAVVLIRTLGRGVYTVYKNPGDDHCTVYNAPDITEADRVQGRFSSFEGSPFGIVGGESFIMHHTREHKEIRGGHSGSGAQSLQNILCAENELVGASERRRPLSLKYDVLMIRQYPGMDMSNYRIGENVKAVLVITYHSSTACTQGRGSLLSILEECKSRGIGMYLASFEEGGSLYDTSDLLLANGAVPLMHVSDETAYAYLLLKVNRGE